MDVGCRVVACHDGNLLLGLDGSAVAVSPRVGEVGNAASSHRVHDASALVALDDAFRLPGLCLGLVVCWYLPGSGILETAGADGSGTARTALLKRIGAVALSCGTAALLADLRLAVKAMAYTCLHLVSGAVSDSDGRSTHGQSLPSACALLPQPGTGSGGR